MMSVKESSIRYKEIVFHWEIRSQEFEFKSQNKTYTEALIEAKVVGYVERKWYRPSTWNNGVKSLSIYY